MKILVISDTHRHLANVYKVLEHMNDDISRVIHLGDHDSDAEDLGYTIDVPIDYVAGNCDFYTDTPREKIITYHGCRILLAHGHHYRVKWNYNTIAHAGMNKKVDLVLFGHTHIPIIKYYNNIAIMNPGSISQPRDGKGPSFGILEIDEKGTFHLTLKKLKKK